MRVAHRHLDFFVSHEIGNGAQINPGHDQTTGERMPQVVPSEILDLRRLKRIVEPVTGALQAITAALSSLYANTFSRPEMELPHDAS